MSKLDDNNKTIQDAKKLRDMISMPGWKDVFEPELQRSIESLKQKILHGDYEDIVELKANQQQLIHQESMLAFVHNTIAEADELLKDETVKIATQKQEAGQL